ncbi:MAG: hypothetical protein H0U70_11050 [Tatlockia sp.]|nr:hypothetical protein [Tatlockia sp.]
MLTNKQERLTFIFSLLFIAFLFLPALGYFFHFPKGLLAGYIESGAVKPPTLVKGWFDKQLQPYLEGIINKDIGFKPLYVRLFNDLTFRLFKEQEQTGIIFTKQHGLYYGSSLIQLNNEYLQRDYLTQVYQQLAKKLLEVQHLYAAKGKHFVVVISASKAYVHLDGLGERFLVKPDKNIYDNIASFGRELKKQGVNVVDSGPILRKFYQKKSIETHPNSGVHWNFYSGCIIAKHLYNNIRTTFSNTPSLRCGLPQYKNPELIDQDGLIVLNVKSKLNLVKKTPYPTTSARFYDNYLPKLLVVSDSFMHQIIMALDQAKSYSSLTISNYYMTNIKHHPTEALTYISPPGSETLEKGILDAAMDSDVVILQMVDYNIPRLGYGFIDPFLKRLHETAAKAQA